MELKNIFEVRRIAASKEIFDLIQDNGDVRIERIISTGQRTTAGEWLVQDESEFVLLLAGKAELEFRSGEVFEMLPGDHVVITPKVEHKVNYTQTDPPTIWLAVHY